MAEHFIKDEYYASNIVKKYLRMKKETEGWDFKEEYELTSGWARLDYLVKAPYKEGHVFFGIECKKGLHAYTSWKDLAKYFEQMVAYQNRPDVDYPIFLGPVVEDKKATPSYYEGTAQYLTNMQAFDRLAGRLNVGVLYMSYKNETQDWRSKFMLRDGSYYDDQYGFHERRMKISVTHNSHIKRVPQKIYMSKGRSD